MTAFLLIALQAIWVVFIARVIFSWIRPKPDSKLYVLIPVASLL